MPNFKFLPYSGDIGALRFSKKPSLVGAEKNHFIYNDPYVIHTNVSTPPPYNYSQE